MGKEISLGFIVFVVDEQHLALSLEMVEKVLRAVEITAIDLSPAYIEGVLNYHGDLLPAINLRKVFGKQSKELHPDDRIIIVTTPKRKIALFVDSVIDLLFPTVDDVVDAVQLDAGLQSIKFINSDLGVIVIHDLEILLNEALIIDLKEVFEMTKQYYGRK